ncbi:uncharacterized protein N7459_001230 [Penicillium hispanicum]|uniref:uncharacterized protein n=1 Tax=Penicillium hispanicum TaxID=1080232 RepID=UPI0025414FCB|nr:uncharacterized protein N7459_001230 [Penicillium hispanicum]KAJ5595022.1 hypothetical protein N7459_001230 [Penicillium hispanicum]
MGFVSDNFGLLYLGAAAVVYFKPEYTICDSRSLTILLLFTTLTFVKIVHRMILYPRFFTPIKHIQTPPNRHWLTGNGDTVFHETPHSRMKEWIKILPNEGLIRFYMTGNMEQVVITSTRALGEFLVTKNYDFVKPRTMRQNLSRILGEGVLLAEGDVHKFQRKNLMPAFAYRHIKDLYPVFWSKATEMTRLIKEDLKARESTGDNVIQIRNWVSRATLDIIGVAGMGQDFDSLRDPGNILSQSYNRIFVPQSSFGRFLFVIGVLLGNMHIFQKFPTQHNKIIDENVKVIRDAARRMIAEKKEKMKDSSAETGIDIISVAMRDGIFDEENLVDQLMTFLGAGHETTATAMQWAIYALSKNPDVQTRLREEIRANLPPISLDNPAPMSAAAIDNLPYLHAVCNEVLRFHPSVPNTVRIAAKDTTLVDKAIPKGTFFVIAPELINHMEEYWGPDADKFNPDRFMGQGMANTGGATSNYALLTFLHGPRGCIGQGFAKSELACLLAATVGSFEFALRDPDAELEIRRGATVSPKDGVMVHLTPLEGW